MFDLIVSKIVENVDNKEKERSFKKSLMYMPFFLFSFCIGFILFSKNFTPFLRCFSLMSEKMTIDGVWLFSFVSLFR